MKIYQPKGRAREYSPLALNYFKGCDHGCKYCYVPPMMKRFNTGYDHTQSTVSLNLPELETSIRKLPAKDRNQQVLLSFTSDPYNNAENGETREVLSILLKHQVHTAILTKNPEKAIRDLDLFKQFKHFKIGTTLVFADEQQRLIWEPGTIHSNRRIEALKTLQTEGITTWASFEPVVYPQHSLLLLEKVAPFIDHVKIGKLNNYKGLDKQVDWQKFIYDATYILRNNNMRFYIKNDLAAYNQVVQFTPEELDPDFLNI